MEEDIRRLQAMSRDQDIWQRSQEPDPKGPKVDHNTNTSIYISQDKDEDETFISNDNNTGDRAKDVVGNKSVHSFPGYKLEVGQEAPERELFLALEALNQYPYRYISASIRERISKEFFANGKIYDRAWDFFYVYPPTSLSSKALILVPSKQVQHFLTTINKSEKTWLKLPSSAIETGLIVDFPKDGTPRPRYLGHSNSPKMVQYLKGAMPSVTYKLDREPSDDLEPTELALEDFKRKIEVFLEHSKQKKVIAKEKKKVKRHAMQRELIHGTKRVQRYLGLRECTSTSSVDQNLKTRAPAKQFGAFTRLDVEDVVPFTQEDNVIFICIDVESYEKNHKIITEVGVATLDTTDLIAVPPGTNGENWRKAIRARHFRIKGTSHLKNTEYVLGCPDHFKFGKTEWVDRKDIPKEVADCFKYPYGAEEDLIFFDDIELQQNRNIILVGHDVATDINYLREIGYDVSNLSNLREVVDTASMDRALQREANPRTLGALLASLDIAGWYLHNAGNDAVYTLQAMIGIAIKSLLQKQNMASLQQEREERMAEQIKLAVEAASERQEGWSTDGSDGGEAVRPSPLLAAAGEKKVGGKKSGAAGDKKGPDDKKAERAEGEKGKRSNVNVWVGEPPASITDAWATRPW